MENKFKLNPVIYYSSFIVSAQESLDLSIAAFNKYSIEGIALYLYAVVLFWKIHNRRNRDPQYNINIYNNSCNINIVNIFRF